MRNVLGRDVLVHRVQLAVERLEHQRTFSSLRREVVGGHTLHRLLQRRGRNRAEMTALKLKNVQICIHVMCIFTHPLLRRVLLVKS